MPFVQRNGQDKIICLFGVRQPDIYEEYLPDDHPEVIEFNAGQPPLPPGFRDPLTKEQMEKFSKERETMEKEGAHMRNAILNFLGFWSNFEVALSSLLHTIIGLPNSQIAHAIYYSPTSFDGRSNILDNSFRQFLSENEKLSGLLQSWELFKNDLDYCRKKRNNVAHGSPLILQIRGKNYLRLSSPAFDVNKIGRKIDTGTIPGIALADLLIHTNVLCQTTESADLINAVIFAYRSNEFSTSNKKSYELELHLQKIVSLRSGDRNLPRQ